MADLERGDPDAMEDEDGVEPALPHARIEQAQSLERGLAVISAFAGGSQTMSISEVARAVDMSRGTVRRFLLTLEDLGYVAQSEHGYYLLPSVLDLGYRHFAERPWWPDAQVLAQQIAGSSGCPCAIAVLEDVSALYACYAAPGPHVVFHRTIGTRLPAHASAVGHVLLAGIDRADLAKRLQSARLDRFTEKTNVSKAALMADLGRVRANGFAYVSEVLEPGLASLGVPVLDRGGDVVAAMSISFRPDDEWTREPQSHPALPQMREAARSLTRLFPT